MHRSMDGQASPKLMTTCGEDHNDNDTDNHNEVKLDNVNMRRFGIPVKNRDNIPKGWAIVPYIMGSEVCDKLGTIGLTWSLVIYLTGTYHIRKVRAANLVNIFTGMAGSTPLLGAFLADTYLGRFRTIFFASFITLMGMVLLFLSALIPSLHPDTCPDGVKDFSICDQMTSTQLAFLFIAFLLFAIGSGGLKACLLVFGADQFPQRSEADKRQLQRFFNLYYVGVYVALLLSSTIMVYIQTRISWTWGFGIPTIAMLLATLIFALGIPHYSVILPQGSPFTHVLQVIVAAFRKRHLPLASVPHFPNPQLEDTLLHTDQFRFLDKATIEVPGDFSKDENVKCNNWRLCSMHSVEEVKCLLRIFPIFFATIAPQIALSQQGTFLIFQAQVMDMHMGPSFEIPPSSMGTFSILSLILWVPIYERFVIPFAQRITKHARGVSLLQRIGIGCFIFVIAIVVSGMVESIRLRTIERISVFWLVPQLCLIGVAESFVAIGQMEFYYDQLPMNLRSLSGALFFASMALGNYGSSFLIILVHNATQAQGKDWLSDDLNEGHLDYFYYVLSAMLVLNFAYFLVCSKFFMYKKNLTSDIQIATIKKDEENGKSSPT